MLNVPALVKGDDDVSSSAAALTSDSSLSVIDLYVYSQKINIQSIQW